MLGSTLVTIQTGPEGKQVNRLYVEQGIDIDRELYLSIVLDRAIGRNVVMASTEGGPRSKRWRRRPRRRSSGRRSTRAIGLGGWQAGAIAYGLGLTGDAYANGDAFLTTLAAAASQVGHRSHRDQPPRGHHRRGRCMALDGKMSFDANALFRHPELAELRDPTEEDPAEIEASSHGLSYVKMDGTIGCMVNGAGLAMSTMDIIKYVGGEPANFLDVGGGADAEQVAAAFRIITKDPNVRGIFVNIFGGIMRCDTIATGVVEAVRQVGLEVPLVVRLEGTNVELGKQIIDESGLDVVNASDMLEGARKIVELAS